MEKFISHPSGPVATATLLVEMEQLLSTRLHLHSHIICQVRNPWEGFRTNRLHGECRGAVGGWLIFSPGEKSGNFVKLYMDSLKSAFKVFRVLLYDCCRDDHDGYECNHPTNNLLDPPWNRGPGGARPRPRCIINRGRHSGCGQDGEIGPHRCFD